MARAEVASASVSSDSIKGLAQSIAKPAYRRLLTAEPALRRAVPALIIAFLLTICVGAIVQVLDHRRQTISDLVKQIDAVGDLLADRLGSVRARKARQARPPPAERTRTHASALGTRSRPPGLHRQCRRHDHRRHPLRAGQQWRRHVGCGSSARTVEDRAQSDRRAGSGATVDHAGRRGRRARNPAGGRHARLRDGAQPRRLEQRPRHRASAQRGARSMAVRHRADRDALGHDRLRRADPRLRLPLAGDARARSRRHLRDRAHPHRYRAQPRPLRIVGLGPRPRPHLLVAFDVRDPRPQAARPTAELRRGRCPCSSRGHPSLRAGRAACRRQGRISSITPSACATPTAIGCGCARAASWCSSRATAGRT